MSSYSGPSQISVPKHHTPSNEDENLQLHLTVICFLAIFIIIILSSCCYFMCLHSTTDSNWDAIERSVDLWLSRQVREMLPIEQAELGLSRIVRDELLVVIFNQSLSLNDLKCSVCLEEYQADENLRKIRRCGHTFHMECIDKWLLSNPTCPICRYSLQTIETVSSIRNSSGGALARPESQPTSEAVSHIDDGQEYIQEVSNESEENGRNNIRTSG